MLALYRSGRQADALEAYRLAREALVAELGLEPGAALRDLQRGILEQDPALAAPRAPSPSPHSAPIAADPRRVMAAAFALASLPSLAALGESLAGGSQRELVIATSVANVAELDGAIGRLAELCEELRGRGVTARSAAFTSLTPGRDLTRLAAEQDVELLVVDAPDGLLEDARLLTLLDEAPCDVAILVGARAPAPGSVLVPFSGAGHDWAAVELGAWLARSARLRAAAGRRQHRRGRARRQPAAGQRLARCAARARHRRRAA